MSNGVRGIFMGGENDSPSLTLIIMLLIFAQSHPQVMHQILEI